MLYTSPLQVGLPPARGTELATIQKDVTDIFVCHKTEMSKIRNLLSPHGFFQAQNAPKAVFGRGPRWGAYDAPPNPLVGWGGGTSSPHSPPP